MAGITFASEFGCPFIIVIVVWSVSLGASTEISLILLATIIGGIWICGRSCVEHE